MQTDAEIEARAGEIIVDALTDALAGWAQQQSLSALAERVYSLGVDRKPDESWSDYCDRMRAESKARPILAEVVRRLRPK